MILRIWGSEKGGEGGLVAMKRGGAEEHGTYLPTLPTP